MASTFSDLKFELIGTGDQSGTWGITTNDNIGVAIEEAITGSADVTFASADVTVTLTDTVAAQTARNLRLNLTGTTGGARNLILGSGCQIEKLYLINNGTADTITVKNTTGTGIAVPAGKSMFVYNNATNVVDATTHLSSLTLGTALPITSGGTGSTSTTFVNLASNVTGTLPIANGGTGLATTTAYGLIAAGTTSTGNFQQVSGTGSSGQVLTSNGAGALPSWQAGASGDVTAAGNNAFTGANTFYNATGQTFAPATTNDGIIIQGRAGGSSTYRVTFATATLSANRTLTFPDATDTAAVLGTAQTFAAAQTFRAANAIRSEAASTQDAVVIAGRAGGTSSYAVTLTPTTLSSSTTLTLPNATDTVAVLGTAQTFTAAQTFRAANAIRSEAASTQDAVVIAGRAGGTSSYAVTLTPATLSASRTLTLPEPGENVTLGYLNIPQNSQSASYTLVLADAGKHIFHPSSDNNARTFTIPANSSVAYPIGTAITFINMAAANVTIAITTDTMYLSSAGTTGSRTLAQYGSATAIKITSTNWIISGSGLT